MILSLNGIIAGKGVILPTSTLNTGIISSYNADSNANDSTGVYNGVEMGGLTYDTGKIGSAFNGNGTNAYISLPNNSLNFTTDFSFSFWIYVTSTPSTQSRYIGSSYYSSGVYGYGWAFGYVPFGTKYRFQLFNGDSNPNSIFESTTSLIDNNQWTHITVVRTRSVSTKIYKNGVDVTYLFTYATGNASINQGYNSTQYCTILALQDNPSTVFGYTNGKMDAVNLWNRALTGSEVTELYNSGNGKQYPY